MPSRGGRGRSGDPMICQCMQVPLSEIRQAVADGARSVDAVRRATTACSGCCTCYPDIEQIIARVIASGEGDQGSVRGSNAE